MLSTGIEEVLREELERERREITCAQEQTKAKAVALELKATHMNLNNYKQRLADLQKTLGIAKEAVFATQSESDSFEQQYKAAKSELDTLHQQYSATLRALDTKDQNLLATISQKEAVETKLETVSRQLEKTTVDLATMQNRFQQSEQRRDTLQESCNIAQEHLTSAKDEAKVLTGERSSLLLLLQVFLSLSLILCLCTFSPFLMFPFVCLFLIYGVLGC